MTHQIAFLGTGIMGAPMAANLIKAGFQAAIWNRTRSKTDSLAELGARVAGGPVDCVKDADYILSILDSGPVVREVFFDSGAANAMKRGAVFIDMASIPPKMAQEHAVRLKERGVGHLDAPVSGGSFGAGEGSLAIMAGGEQADFDRTERDGVWKPMGRAVVEEYKNSRNACVSWLSIAARRRRWSAPLARGGRSGWNWRVAF